MFKLNGIDTEVIMRPLNFADFGNDANVSERTNSVEVEKKSVDSNNIEEKEDGNKSGQSGL